MTLKANVSLVREDFRLDAHLDAPAGAVTAIYGASGSGKTTLLDAIAGLVPECTGTVSVDGHPWQRGDTGLPAHKRRVGYVFQDAQLFSHQSVKKNLLYGARRRETATKLTDVVDLLDLQGLLSKQPTQLSGGEKRRVSLGRALLANPALLLLDEPLSGLDDARKEDIYPYLETLQHELDIPTVLVTHSTTELLRLADRVARMRAGRLEAARSLDGFDDDSGRGPWTVIECRVTHYDGQDRLLEVKSSGQALLLPADKKPKASRLRAVIAASDISLTTAAADPTSILNRLLATIERVEPKTSFAIVSLMVGKLRLKARISLRSVRELNLGVGKPVTAQIKAVSVRSSFGAR